MQEARRVTKRPAADSSLGSATKRFSAYTTQTSSQRQLLTVQSQVTELQNALLEKQAAIDRLESDRRWLAEREEGEKLAREEEGKEWEHEREQLTKQLSEARRRITEVESNYHQLKDVHANSVRESRAEILCIKRDLAEARSAVTSLEQDVLAQRQRQTAEPRANSDEPQLEYPSFNPNSDDNDIIRAELLRQSAYMRSLEAANSRLNAELSRLRPRAEGADILREEKRALESKVVVTDQLRSRVADLEVQLSKATTLNSVSDSKGTRSQVSTLQKEQLELLDKMGQITAQLHQAEKELLNLQSENSDLVSTSKALRSELEQAQTELLATRNEEKLNVALAAQEVTFLKSLIASYAEENVDSPEPRVAQLTHLLHEYQSSSKADQALERATEAEKQLSSYRESLEASQREIETLSQTLFELSGEIAAGRHVPPKTRIVSLACNPFFDDMGNTQDEIERLRNEIKVLTGPNWASDGAPSVTIERYEREKDAMQKEIDGAKKRLLRLKEIFTLKGEEFREAITSVLGFRTAFYPNGQVRLTSQYDLSVAFVFQPSRDPNGKSKMQLVAQTEPNGGEDELNLDQLMRYWVEERGCMPGFLASVTLECWERSQRRKAEEDNE